ncbi:MAG: glycosyltransferase family 2 protein [Lyngbya sp. HA4199-MV5]|jgi:glycosyltransferase involved in cell wall biosynthesis|nr:glycosyltransferase family 2 protein [Lyngbya sp. HA4199-MV5]
MKLSVILPCFNGAQTIAVQLEALVNQQWPGVWEVVVVNNGSTDNSVEIVEQYRDRLPDLRVVDAYTPPGPRLGVSHSYNVGLKAATGDAFVFCEADDEVASDWLAAMANALAQFEFVAGALEHKRLNEDWLSAAHDKGAQSEGLVGVTYPPYLPFAFGCNMGIRRSLYEAMGELDESLICAWDMDYSWKVQLAGTKLHFVPEAVVHYRLRHTLKALYRQGNNWGPELPLLQQRYGMKMDWSVFRNHLFYLLKYLPGGVKLLPMSIFRIRRGRGGFAWWVWGLGYSLGYAQGLLDLLLHSSSSERSLESSAQRSQKPVDAKANP